MKIDGRCHWGFIMYEAEVNSDEVYVCHCTDCQAISGAAFRWAVPVPEAALAIRNLAPISARIRALPPIRPALHGSGSQH
jgi:hypothetical protein